jgi:RNA methyltransferase, TrmH family
MEQEITSVNNELVKEAVKLHQKKYRDEQKKFLLEGFKAVEEALKSGIEIEWIFVDKKRVQKYEFLNAPKISTTQPVLKKISTTDSAPDIVAVAKQKIFTLNDIKSAQKVILLENIKDLGNLGTILRTAKAFSQDAIILFGDTVDLYNPKCVRSAVGNLWKIPVVQIKDLKILKTFFKEFEKVAALPHAKDTVNLKDFAAKPPYLIMFGSESEGLSQELINFSTKKITIEINSEVESLNLSVSVGIILNALIS